MKTQQIDTRHHWLMIKRTIGTNSVPSLLNTGCEPRYTMYRKGRYDIQPIYSIDILGIFEKVSIFLKGLTTFFAVSVQTDWQKTADSTTSKVIKSS